MDDMITGSLPAPYEKSSDAAYDINQDKSPEQAEIEQEQLQEDYNLAALIDHPGWKQIYDSMKNDIDTLWNGTEIDTSKYTDKELGEVFRSDRTAADKLKKYITKYENAVRAVAERGSKQ